MIVTARPTFRIATLILCAVAAPSCGEDAKKAPPRATQPSGPTSPASADPAEATAKPLLGDIIRLPGKMRSDAPIDVAMDGSTVLVAWYDATAKQIRAQEIAQATTKPKAEAPVVISAKQPVAVASVTEHQRHRIAYIQSDGAHLVSVEKGSIERVGVVPGTFTSLDAIDLANGSTAVALKSADSVTIAVFGSRRGVTDETSLDASNDRRDAQSIALVRRANGYTLAFSAADGKLTVASSDTPTGTPTLHPLPVIHGAARLGIGPDNTLHVLYGGTASKGAAAGRGELGYSWQQPGKRWAHTSLERELQCDTTGFLVGIAPFAKPLMLYGYGCDVGWGVTSARGKELSPARLADDIGRKGFIPKSVSASSQHVALAGYMTLRGQLGVQILSPA